MWCQSRACGCRGGAKSSGLHLGPRGMQHVYSALSGHFMNLLFAFCKEVKQFSQIVLLVEEGKHSE